MVVLVTSLLTSPTPKSIHIFPATRVHIWWLFVNSFMGYRENFRQTSTDRQTDGQTDKWTYLSLLTSNNLNWFFPEDVDIFYHWSNTSLTGNRNEQYVYLWDVNSSPPGQNGRLLADGIFKCIFVNENLCILINISLKFVLKGSKDNNPALVQIMAWRRIGDKSLSKSMLTRFTDEFTRH